MPAAPYHHGNLRESLVVAAIDVAREHGPDGLALRDLARRVGVSHNAAYRHFADRDALVAEVALRGMAGLVAAMQAGLDRVDETDPVLRARLRLLAIGRSYVDFALAEPGLYRVGFSSYPAESISEQLKEQVLPGVDPFALLNTVLDDLVDVGFLHPDERPGAEITCWSAVHGFSTLHLNGPLSGEVADVRDQTLMQMLTTLDRAYAATTGSPVERGDLTGSL